MKNIYWSTTIIFAAFMTFTAVPDILKLNDAMAFITQLGYPAYFIPFIGWAKVAGSIAILIPGMNKVKEWAYAGLFFDLIGAFYSVNMVHGFDPSSLMIFIFIGVLFTSYFYNIKMYQK